MTYPIQPLLNRLPHSAYGSNHLQHRAAAQPLFQAGQASENTAPSKNPSWLWQKTKNLGRRLKQGALASTSIFHRRNLKQLGIGVLSSTVVLTVLNLFFMGPAAFMIAPVFAGASLLWYLTLGFLNGLTGPLPPESKPKR